MSTGNWGETIQSPSSGDGTYLRDYTHAGRVFQPNAAALVPKFKFLFHVYFDINIDPYYSSQVPLGLAVKTAKLPSYTFATEALNQYNRKRIVQTKLKYNNVNIEFHDDNSNMITHLWESYYTYYYKDGSNFGGILKGARGGLNSNSDKTGQQPENDYNKRNIYQGDITGNVNWGYTGESYIPGGVKMPFFNNITIFGFNRHQFTAYTLISPLITSFNHDTYNYSEGGGTMQMSMDLEYESVVYNDGALDGQSPDNIIQGFGLNSHYDRRLSPITPAGSNSKVPGQGGYVPSSGGYVNQNSDWS